MTRNDVINIANELTGDEGHNKILKIYNSQKNLPRGYVVRINDPWCATFVSAVLTMAGYDKINECSCNEMTKKAKLLGIFKPTGNIEIGDVILYDWQNDGTPDHVGIVIEKTDNEIIVREGNKSGTIGNRKLTYNNVNIFGTIKIPYNDAPDFETRKARLIEFIDNMDWSKVTKNDIIKAIKEGL